MLNETLFKRHLEDDEHIAMVAHKHWLVGLRFLVWPTVSFLLALGVLSVRHSPTAVLLIAIWATFSAVWWFRNFLDYYLDAWVITNHGIIDLEWLGWFHRQSSRILYSDIQGVSYEIHGVLGTMMRFGTISIEKISTGSAVSLDDVPRPRAVESVILQNMETYLHGKNMKNAKHIEELLSKFVAEHINEESVRKGKKEEEPKAPPTRTTKKSFHSVRLRSP